MKLDLKELIAKLTNTPMVIEQGTNGIWNYRKWSNGVSECWGIQSVSLTNYATVASGLYGYYTVVAFPTGLFINTPTVVYSAGVGQGFGWAGAHMGATFSSVTLYAVGTLSGTQACLFEITAKGRWKQ